MMLSKFSSLLSSEARYLVPETRERQFLVPGGLLASQSKKLESLVVAAGDSPLGSAVQGEVAIGSWDTATVARFLEYVYTGDYHCPDPTQLVETPAASEEGSTLEQESDTKLPQAGVPQDKVLDDNRPLTPLSDYFPAGPSPPENVFSKQEFIKQHFRSAKYDFEDAFLAHAKVYALALELEVEALCTLALRRLLRILVGIEKGQVQPCSPVIENFVDLARYTYKHTYDTKDPLRKIVSQFAAFNITDLQSKELRELFTEGGDFLIDLMGRVSRRLVSSDKLCETLERNQQTIEHNLKLQLDQERKAKDDFRVGFDQEQKAKNDLQAKFDQEQKAKNDLQAKVDKLSKRRL